MLAALTGALTASRLGIAGTIIGAAFMSLASTVGSAIYKHYITSSNERLRKAAASLAPKASHSAVASAVGRHHAQEELARPGRTRLDQTRPGAAGPGAAGPGAVRPEPAQWYPARELGAPPAPAHGYVSPDGTETQILPARYQNGDLASARTQTVAWDQPSDRGGPADTIHSAPTGPADLGGFGGDVPTARLRAPGDPGRPDQPGSAGAAPGGGHRWAWARRRWVIAVATALGVFAVTMGAVTVFEVLAGKPLDAVVWHQHSSGTTLGGLVGGSGGHHPRPSTSPTPTHSPGSSHSPRPSQTPSSSPTPTNSSPAPTPSGSPSPTSSAPSGSASTPAAPNSSPPAAQTASPGASR